MTVQGVPGIYTLAELFRQQARPPLDLGRGRGWRLRVVVGSFLPSMFPEVSMWSDQLTFGFTTQLLRRLMVLAAQNLSLTVNQARLEELVREAFPTQYRPLTAEPLARVDGQLSLFLDEVRMTPNPADSFWLLSPVKFNSVAVPLVPQGNELVATVPDDLLNEMRDACARVLMTTLC